MLELQFADHAGLKSKGRNFTCAGCPEQVQKLRRCWEDRWDFTSEDAAFFPMQIDGGGFYGFCPGKATRDHEAVFLFEMLSVCAEQKTLLVGGGLIDQPGWFVKLMAWFAPAYAMQNFSQKAQMVLGKGDSKPKGPMGQKPSGQRGT